MKLPQLIGSIQLPALPGSPGANRWLPADALQNAGIQAVQKAQAFEKAGFDGVILENSGDVPFFKDKVSPETIASMAIIAATLKEAVSIQVGINVLRNDAHSALAIAAVTGCHFIRVHVFTGVTATDQGLLEGQAATLLRERDRLQSSVKILAESVENTIVFFCEKTLVKINKLIIKRYFFIIIIYYLSFS